MMNEKIRAGVIGAGRIGRVHIENLARKIPGVELSVVADVNMNEEMGSWLKDLGIANRTNDVNEIFDNSDIDAVIICSSTDTHAEFIQRAALSGKDAFCEKPIDTDVTRIKETLKIVEQEGVKLMVGFNRRFDENFRRLRERIELGHLGEPHVVKITSRDPAPPPIEYVKVSGGIFMDMTIHDWDMARFIAGSEVEEVYASGAVLIDPEIGKAGDVDTATANLKFRNGALGVIDNSRKAVYGYDQRVEFFGSKGCGIAGNERSSTVEISTVDRIEADKIPYFFLERYKESYEHEMTHFIQCLMDDKSPRPSGEDGLQDVLVAKAAQKSLDENRPVKISEIDN